MGISIRIERNRRHDLAIDHNIDDRAWSTAGHVDFESGLGGLFFKRDFRTERAVHDGRRKLSGARAVTRAVAPSARDATNRSREQRCANKLCALLY